MKIPTFLIASLLLNIATIFICTNALGEEENIPNAENIYPSPPPNRPQEGEGITSGQTETVYNENDLDEIINKFNPEDLNEIMALLDDEEIGNQGNIPTIIDQQSIQKMKIPTLLFIIIFLLNISTIFICTNALDEEGNIPTLENIYPPPSQNEHLDRGEANGQQATVDNENDSDEIMNKFKPEDLNEIMALLDEDNWKNENIPAAIGTQSIHPNQQSPLKLAAKNLPNWESGINVRQKSQLNKAPIIGVKRSFYETDNLAWLRDNRRKTDNKIYNLNRESQNQKAWRFIKAGENDIGAGALQRKKDKSKLDEYLEQNSSNSNEMKHESKPKYQFNSSDNFEVDYEWLLNWLSSNEEKVPHTLSAQQNSPINNNIAMNNQPMEQKSMQNIQQIIAKSSSNPTKMIISNQQNSKDLWEKYTGIKTNPLKMHKAAKKKNFNCNECGKTFDCKSRLNKHLLSHQSERPHKCEKCGADYKRKGDLMVHLRMTKCGTKANKLESGKGRN